jgi:hypothetical protein
MISVLPRKRREDVRIDGQVVPKKTHFAIWDRLSRRMEISMKMLVIKLKSAS